MQNLKLDFLLRNNKCPIRLTAVEQPAKVTCTIIVIAIKFSEEDVGWTESVRLRPDGERRVEECFYRFFDDIRTITNINMCGYIYIYIKVEVEGVKWR